MLKDITPAHLKCGYLLTCPAVYEEENGDLVIVGKKPKQEIYEELKNKVGEDELVITIRRDFFQKLGG